MIVGLYDIPEDELHLARDVGADVVHTYSLLWTPPSEVNTWKTTKKEQYLAYMDAAWTYGLKVMPEIPRFFFDLHTDEYIEFLRTITKHPAFYSWYIADEPELRPEMTKKKVFEVELAAVLAMVEIFAGSGTRIATARVSSHFFGYGYKADKYMTSFYDISRYLGGRFGSWLTYLKWLYMKGRYRMDRVIPIIQTHDIARFEDPLDTKSWRAPTEEEMKNQVKMAKRMNAEEIWFWGFHAEHGHELYTLKDNDRRIIAHNVIYEAHKL
jgi:hypothetical protein